MAAKQWTDASVLEVVNALRAVATVSRCVTVEDIEAFVRQAEYEDSFVPLFDPSLWMRTHRSVDFWRRVAEAFLVWRRAVDQIAAEQEAGGG